jgi:hypothetical protein
MKEATVVVSVERLREIEWLESHNGDEPKSCPACLRYQSFGHLPDCWLAALLREETVPPKPTPPPLREIREGRVPARAGACRRGRRSRG